MCAQHVPEFISHSGHLFVIHVCTKKINNKTLSRSSISLALTLLVTSRVPHFRFKIDETSGSKLTPSAGHPEQKRHDSANRRRSFFFGGLGYNVPEHYFLTIRTRSSTIKIFTRKSFQVRQTHKMADESCCHGARRIGLVRFCSSICSFANRAGARGGGGGGGWGGGWQPGAPEW